MHKSASMNVVTYQKNRAAPNSSNHQNIRNAKIKENISSALSKIAVIDIERKKTDYQRLFRCIVRV